METEVVTQQHQVTPYRQNLRGEGQEIAKPILEKAGQGRAFPLGTSVPTGGSVEYDVSNTQY